MIKPLPASWLRLIRKLHRDLGYLVIGLTIVFAVSGIAVNHIHDWNPNYKVERFELPHHLNQSATDDSLNKGLISLFAIKQPVKASYWETSQDYKVFLQNGSTLTANFVSNKAVFEQISERPLLKQFNALHLNEVKSGWVIFSDIYAGILLFLAISALFMVRGRNSPWGARKGWLVALGILIPVTYMMI